MFDHLRILIAAAFLSTTTFATETVETIAHVHPDMRLSSEGGHQTNRGAFIATQFRYALHDFLDRKGDYPHSTAIEIASLKWRMHLQNMRPWLDEATLLRVTRIPTLSDNDGELSWSFETGLRTMRENLCANCLGGHARGGLGVTEALIRGFPMEIFLLAEAEIALVPDARDGAFQPAVGPWAGVRLWWADNWNALASVRYRYYFLSSNGGNFEASAAIRYYLGWSLAVQARITKFPDGWESAGGLYVYF